MRLWHYKLLEVLPRQQLLGQWRELNSIFKKQDKHILINFIYDYPKEHLLLYSNLVMFEMRDRGYNIKTLDNYYKYFAGIVSTGNVIRCFPDKMNDRYLKQCYYNLQEKYDCKSISKEEWERIEEWKQLKNI